MNIPVVVVGGAAAVVAYILYRRVRRGSGTATSSQPEQNPWPVWKDSAWYTGWGVAKRSMIAQAAFAMLTWFVVWGLCIDWGYMCFVYTPVILASLAAEYKINMALALGRDNDAFYWGMLNLFCFWGWLALGFMGAFSVHEWLGFDFLECLRYPFWEEPMARSWVWLRELWERL